MDRLQEAIRSHWSVEVRWSGQYSPTLNMQGQIGGATPLYQFFIYLNNCVHFTRGLESTIPRETGRRKKTLEKMCMHWYNKHATDIANYRLNFKKGHFYQPPPLQTCLLSGGRNFDLLWPWKCLVE